MDRVSGLDEPVGQTEVEQQLQAAVVGHQVHAGRRPLDQMLPDARRVVDEQAFVLRPLEPLAGSGRDGTIAQVRAVAPQRVVQTPGERGLWGQRGGLGLDIVLGQDGHKGVQGAVQLGGLLRCKGVDIAPGAWLVKTHDLHQAPVKKGLGKVPGHVQPGAALKGRPRPVPQVDVWGVLVQGLDGQGGDLGRERAQRGLNAPEDSRRPG